MTTCGHSLCVFQIFSLLSAGPSMQPRSISRFKTSGLHNEAASCSASLRTSGRPVKQKAASVRAAITGWGWGQDMQYRHAKVGKEKCVRTVGSRPEMPRAGFLRRAANPLPTSYVVWGSAVSSPAGLGWSPRRSRIEFSVF